MLPVHLRIETRQRAEVLPLLPALARLRTEVFRDWPYLYAGEEGYERGYLRAYAESPGAAVVVALDGEVPVGAATCQPMAEAHGPVREAFLAQGLDPARYCYFGESVLLRAYRGQGAGVAFFRHREAHARRLGLSHAAFCAVQREPSDPRRPLDYAPLDAFWRRRGYTPHPGLACVFTWREVGATAETPHTLTFWTKPLDRAELP